MKLAVTGANGLFGRHLCALLEAKGIAHRPLTRADWDLRDWAAPERLDALTAGADTLVHAAARLPSEPSARELFDTNVRATLNLADWARQRGIHMIHLSSGSVYADPYADAITEDAPMGPGPLGGVYAQSKRLAEMALADCRSMGLKLTVLRPSSVYGAGLNAEQLVARLLAEAESGGPVTVTGGASRINFLHIHDLARAAIMAAERGATGLFNIAGDAPTRLVDLAQAIADLVGVTAEDAPPKAGAPPFTLFDLDTRAARDRLGFAPSIPLATGLAMMRAGALLPADQT
ncbi:NAD-dependent epimerase/dehydratase family protein [Jannaschia ovalis]|uniref:NAD(P)-dependent oxidoreductase n=1 Tax=Jannaschia ovalis TaxID=3038773 RepID=A0ABY8LC64_9RHOB|nr:NAD(P)-dependent oxidoreductase [Jannaschia sp. GRR-S6-38]WGH78721.1 NAD(P)-dependent oxidoreductase [Jannaschia sp. GRR-S6-38]